MQSDKVLLEELANGGREATAYVYKKYRKPLVTWLMQRGAQEEDAEDVFQEALVVLYEQASKESFRLTCAISTYLFAVSKNIYLKKQRKDVQVPLDFKDHTDLENDYDLQAHQDVQLYVEKEQQYRRLEAGLSLLGSPCKELLQAFYMKDKSMRDIAADFGYTNAENAKTQKYKCLQRLKKLLTIG